MEKIFATHGVDKHFITPDNRDFAELEQKYENVNI